MRGTLLRWVESFGVGWDTMRGALSVGGNRLYVGITSVLV